ncbi:MAG: hypothetical protein JO168_12585 [Solirubrobacterales bacterium]|nr:hypothetical protein [Solirubrobacterales bacterium]
MAVTAGDDGEGAAANPAPGRLSTGLARARALANLAYRDPDHVVERLTLEFTARAAEPARAWAQATTGRPTAEVSATAADLCRRTVQLAGIDGAVAGTPFLIALVPAYLDYLYHEGTMVLRLAALYGRDPGGLRTAAEFLVLRGTHPDVEAAQAALEHVRETPMPEKPSQRRPLRNWILSVRALAVFSGFISASRQRDRDTGRVDRLRLIGGSLLAAVVWLMTWILPITFMLAMAWGCDQHARSLARRAMALYGGDEGVAALDRARAGGERRLLRTAALVLSVAVPIAFVALADRARNHTGIGPLPAGGAIVALGLVIAVGAVVRRAGRP